MALKPDAHFEAIERALKAAARDATHGTREQRSGRFLPAKAGASSDPPRPPVTAPPANRKP
jgi:hypothetical protein